MRSGRPTHRASVASFALFAALCPAASHAHGFAVRYDLPLPLGFFLAGAGATVLLSFVLLAVLPRQRAAGDVFLSPERELPTLSRVLSNNLVAEAIGWLGVGLFMLVIAAALFGDTNPFKNISTTMVWLIWWVGMMFINTFIGDLWAVINPWNTLFAAAEGLARKLKPGARLSLDRPYPARLEIWPAVILFLVFAWIEIISGEGEDVRKLGAFIIAYSLITWGGMWLFGREIWLRHGEAFTVVFSMFARFAPLARNTRFLVLRPPGAGLLVSEPVSWSTAAVVLVLLGTVTFDGFIATPTWSALYETYTGLAKARPALTGVFNFYVLATAVFLLFPVFFGGVFLACCRATVALSGRLTASETARYFVLTLLPIAIAYHVAHYLVFFLLSGQYIVPALSDPFGYGWDLFGTASYKPDVGLVGARFAWYTSVVAIVTGHVIAVQLAHRMAVHLFGDGKRMFASELPLLALMVGYTMLSLWIIAQPTVS
jgi:hypothetical protein